MGLLGKLAIPVLVAAAAFAATTLMPHDEAALLSDWSAPPPWPVFIGLNVLAGALRAASDALTPPPIRMLDMAMGYHSTQLVHVAQKFHIADLLAAGPMSPEEIASSIGSDADIVERIMYACAAQGVFKLAPVEEGKGRRFINTALSAVLRVDHPNSLRGMVGHNAEDGYPAWGKLADYVANPTGPDPWTLAFPEFPAGKGGIWGFFKSNPASEAQFGAAMTSLDSLGAEAMVADGPWERFTRVIDVGGSMGHFTHRILSAHPSIHAVVVDRPEVISIASEKWETGEFSSASDRVELKSGDFSKPSDVPAAAEGDAYLLRYVLHDWPGDKALEILKSIRSAMGTTTNTTLLIGECAIPDHDVVGVPPVMYQIDIQMMAFFGVAKERTPEQWKQILAEAGFEIETIHATRSLLQWVEAKPV